jgi:hypothetical protein
VFNHGVVGKAKAIDSEEDLVYIFQNDVLKHDYGNFDKIKKYK